ncbi:MAG: hypothetical protein IKM24_07155, partial [Clostridia bacterium]|nr:hypothetical protein [Clostridia bacterium]
GSNFTYVDDNETQLLSGQQFPPRAGYPQGGAVQAPYGQNGASFAQPPAPKKKRMRWWQILIIVLCCLVVLGSVGTGIMFAMDDNSDVVDNDDYYFDENYTFDTSFTDEADTQEVTEAGVPYTKGVLADGVYVNEWANIKMTVPADFVNADSETYASSENAVTDCGLYLMSNDTMRLIYFCYEKLPTFSSYDEEKYLDAAMKALKDVEEIEFRQISDTYKTTEIAGETYLTTDVIFDNGYGEFLQSVYVRKLGNYMIFICAISQDAEANAAMVNAITPIE